MLAGAAAVLEAGALDAGAVLDLGAALALGFAAAVFAFAAEPPVTAYNEDVMSRIVDMKVK